MEYPIRSRTRYQLMWRWPIHERKDRSSICAEIQRVERHNGHQVSALAPLPHCAMRALQMRALQTLQHTAAGRTEVCNKNHAAHQHTRWLHHREPCCVPALDLPASRIDCDVAKVVRRLAREESSTRYLGHLDGNGRHLQSALQCEVDPCSVRWIPAV